MSLVALKVLSGDLFSMKKNMFSIPNVQHLKQRLCVHMAWPYIMWHSRQLISFSLVSTHCRLSTTRGSQSLAKAWKSFREFWPQPTAPKKPN